MGIPAKQFGGKGSTIQVGGLKTSDAKRLDTVGTGEVFDANADRIVELHNIGSADCYYRLRVGAAPAAISSGGADQCGFISAKNSTRPFILPANTYITATQVVVITALDVETKTTAY